jgi:hypothetical protein
MIATSPFGKTGHQSTRAIFGAAALGGMKQEKADRVLDILLEYASSIPPAKRRKLPIAPSSRPTSRITRWNRCSFRAFQTRSEAAHDGKRGGQLLETPGR